MNGFLKDLIQIQIMHEHSDYECISGSNFEYHENNMKVTFGLFLNCELDCWRG